MPALVKIVQYTAEQDKRECVCTCGFLDFGIHADGNNQQREDLGAKREICDIPGEIKEHNIRLKEDRNPSQDQSPPGFGASCTGQILVQVGL